MAVSLCRPNDRPFASVVRPHLDRLDDSLSLPTRFPTLLRGPSSLGMVAEINVDEPTSHPLYSRYRRTPDQRLQCQGMDQQSKTTLRDTFSSPIGIIRRGRCLFTWPANRQFYPSLESVFLNEESNRGTLNRLGPKRVFGISTNPQ